MRVWRSPIGEKSEASEQNRNTRRLDVQWSRDTEKRKVELPSQPWSRFALRCHPWIVDPRAVYYSVHVVKSLQICVSAGHGPRLRTISGIFYKLHMYSKHRKIQKPSSHQYDIKPVLKLDFSQQPFKYQTETSKLYTYVGRNGKQYPASSKINIQSTFYLHECITKGLFCISNEFKMCPCLQSPRGKPEHVYTTRGQCFDQKAVIYVRLITLTNNNVHVPPCPPEKR